MNLIKIDKFYLSLGVILLGLSILVIFTFKVVFSAFISSYGVGSVGGVDLELKVNSDRLSEVHAWAFEREAPELLIK